ncbi:MAG: fasciclin domain-containing protein, partial [Chloroflexota bacterium]
LDGAVDSTAFVELLADGPVEVEMLSGEMLMAELVDGTIVLNGGQATVAAADVMADNGIIHVIDGVLLPPSMTMMGEEMMEEDMEMMATEEPMMEEDMEMMESNTIVDVAVNTEGFSTLVAAADAAGLVEALSGGELTVFAPTDDAFAAALEALGLSAEELLADTETLTTILTYHVLDGAVDSTAFVELLADGPVEVEMLSGEMLMAELVDGTIVLNGGQATVAAADVMADNGIIHVIDGVLLPPSMQ